MNWQALADLLQEVLDGLFEDTIPSLRSLVPASADAASEIVSIDKLFQKGVGRAVFEYTMTGQWPETLTGEEKTLLFYHLKFAIALAHSLADNQRVGGERLLANLPDDAKTKADLIQWLLEYAWEQGGRGYTVAVCAGLLTAPPARPLDLSKN